MFARRSSALLAIALVGRGVRPALGLGGHARGPARDGVQHRVRRHGGELRQHRPCGPGRRRRRGRRRGGVRQRAAARRRARVPVLQRPAPGHLAAAADRRAGRERPLPVRRDRSRTGRRARERASPGGPVQPEPGATRREAIDDPGDRTTRARARRGARGDRAHRPGRSGDPRDAARRFQHAVAAGLDARDGRAPRADPLPGQLADEPVRRGRGIRGFLSGCPSGSGREPGADVAVREAAPAGRLESRAERARRSDRLHLHRRRRPDPRERRGRRIGWSRRHDRRRPVGHRPPRRRVRALGPGRRPPHARGRRFPPRRGGNRSDAHVPRARRARPAPRRHTCRRGIPPIPSPTSRSPARSTAPWRSRPMAGIPERTSPC